MKKKLVVAAVAMGVLGIVFMVTSPTEVPAFMLIIPFVCVFVALSSLLFYVGERRGMSRTHSFRLAIIGAGIPVVLLVLQSIGQLTLRDILTLGAIFVILYFYMSRVSFKK